MGVHDNHRQRMKEKYLAGGLDAFHDHEVLEILLYFAVPRQDTNPIAHQLLQAFGSLHAVLEAPVDELTHVSGIGQNSALLIHLCFDLFRRYRIDRSEQERGSTPLHTADAIGAYLAPQFTGLTEERVIATCVDNRGKVLCCQQVSNGIVDMTDINLRKIVELAVRFNAHGVILAHNHPRGTALPSREDINTTLAVKKALSMMHITLVDHIIIADDDFVSLRDSAML